ncbi:transporter [Sphingomonas donggukensis]|uniref:Transporter n=1 Tax=Sphingomonas donggukensis TaxID=2949093 RepID=A0ABY4U2V8_9SPHN|nr:transporter [Sphingomonas donggukensis]URW76888.1 transporter [Sphingomonas donggukensis]
MGAASVKRIAAAIAVCTATPAIAQDRDLCTDRPGLGTPPCIVDRGRVQVETGLADWTSTDDAEARSDTLIIGETVVRIGVSDTIEAQIGFTPYGRERVRTKATGAIDRSDGVGDLLLGAKIGLANPEGSGFSAAVQPQVTLPVGRAPAGAGDWGAVVVVPVSYELPGGVSLQASPQIAAAVDEDRRGRHVAWGTTVGLGIDLTDTLGLGLEVQAVRDYDPLGATTQSYAGVSLAWQRGRDLMLDVGLNAGLNRDSDDVELYVGFSRRF